MGENQKKIINNSLKKYYNIKSGNLYLIDMPPLEDIKDVYVNKDNNDKDDEDIQVEINFKDIFKYLLIHKKMITIGLYKKYTQKKENITSDQSKKEKTNIKSDLNNIYYSEQSHYYVVTSPNPDFKVTNKDKLFVISTIYPGKNLDLKTNSENQIQNSEQFTMDKNEIERQNNKMRNLESKQNLDREGEKKLEKINDTIDEMKILLNSTKNTLLELGIKTKQIIPESIKSTITNIYQTNNLP